MICTACFKQTGAAFDSAGLSAETILALCESWRCNACLDDLDRRAIDRGEHPPTQPPPSDEWS